jgi:hypothetical protein
VAISKKVGNKFTLEKEIAEVEVHLQQKLREIKSCGD